MTTALCSLWFLVVDDNKSTLFPSFLPLRRLFLPLSTTSVRWIIWTENERVPINLVVTVRMVQQQLTREGPWSASTFCTSGLDSLLCSAVSLFLSPSFLLSFDKSGITSNARAAAYIFTEYRPLSLPSSLLRDLAQLESSVSIMPWSSAGDSETLALSNSCPILYTGPSKKGGIVRMKVLSALLSTWVPPSVASCALWREGDGFYFNDATAFLQVHFALVQGTRLFRALSLQ